MKELIACCGLDCERCDARIATIQNDDALREKTAKLWSELNQAPITPEMINCLGCRADGVKTPFCAFMCQIRSCVQKNGLSTCADCGELVRCETLKSITVGCPQALDNLNQIKSQGGTGNAL